MKTNRKDKQKRESWFTRLLDWLAKAQELNDRYGMPYYRCDPFACMDW